MSLLDLIVLGLAANRLWAIWLYSELARPIRDWFIRRGNKLAYFASCQLCVSVWAGFVVTALWLVGAHILNFALAAGVIVFAWQTILTLMDSTAQRQQIETQAKVRELSGQSN